MSGCGGECCGIEHKFRILWQDNPRFVKRAKFAAGVLRRAYLVYNDHAFTHNDIYHLIHDDFYARPDIASLPLWEQIKLCPTCSWDHFVCEWLHTNGYIALLKRYPGAQRGRYIITELGHELISMQEAA